MDEEKSPASAASSGVKGSIGSSTVNISPETARDILSFLFNSEYLGIIMALIGLLGLAFILAQFARDYFNRTPDDCAPSSFNNTDICNLGKLNLDEKDCVSHVTRPNNGGGPRRYNGRNAEAEIKRVGCKDIVRIGIAGNLGVTGGHVQ